jgi:hypothetical protein
MTQYKANALNSKEDTANTRYFFHEKGVLKILLKAKIQARWVRTMSKGKKSPLYWAVKIARKPSARYQAPKKMAKVFFEANKIEMNQLIDVATRRPVT